MLEMLNKAQPLPKNKAGALEIGAMQRYAHYLNQVRIFGRGRLLLDDLPPFDHDMPCDRGNRYDPNAPPQVTGPKKGEHLWGVSD